MKLAIIGSRNLNVRDMGKYLPLNITEIVSGGARGVDVDAAEYARDSGIKLVEFFPEYSVYGRAAPLKRNEQIAEYADEAIAFWDGHSKGTEYTINLFRKMGKKVNVVYCRRGESFLNFAKQ